MGDAVVSGTGTSISRVCELCYYLPPLNAESGASNDPQLIMIFGWSLAELFHLSKYSREYSRIYPGAAQVLILSDLAAIALGTGHANLRRQRPIIRMLAELGVFCETPPRTLVHVFSNGGAVQLAFLALALEKDPPRYSSDKSLITHTTTCLILDSVPGAGRHSECQIGLAHVNTFSPALFATAVWAGSNFLELLGARPFLHSLVYEGLLRPNARLPWLDTSVPRLYLYSDVDPVAQLPDVQRHIEEARRRGMDVQEVLFTGSPHVMHARVYPRRYWGAVRERWTDAVKLTRRERAKL